MTSCFKKKAEVKLELLAIIDALLMVEKSIRWGICYEIHWYAKANNKYIKDYDRKKNHQIWNIGIKIIHMVG